MFTLCPQRPRIYHGTILNNSTSKSVWEVSHWVGTQWHFLASQEIDGGDDSGIGVSGSEMRF